MTYLRQAAERVEEFASREGEPAFDGEECEELFDLIAKQSAFHAWLRHRLCQLKSNWDRAGREQAKRFQKLARKWVAERKRRGG